MTPGFVDHCLSGYPVLWVATSEPHRAQKDLSGQLQKEWSDRFGEDGLVLLRWDVLTGLTTSEGHPVGSPDPVEAITNLSQVQGELVVAFFWNLHQFMEPGVVQAILNGVKVWKATGKVLVVLAPSTSIPCEVEKYVTILDFSLPDEKGLREILDNLTKSVQEEDSSFPAPSEEEANALVAAGKGLSAFEFENALALCIATEGSFSISVVLEMKEQLVKKAEALEFYKPSAEDSFSFIGGLGNLKSFCLSTCKSPLSKGVLLLGVPGTGKSAFSKALGGEAGLPALSLDVGAVFGSLVGESERRIREALKVVEAMAPCVLFIDEIEKGLAGSEASGRTDSGVTARVVSTFLTWMQDCPAHVYVVATCNSIDKLPPEMLRAERWDAIFFIDLPLSEEQAIIWKIWGNYYKVNIDHLPPHQGWTGAEIRTCCRLAAMMGCTVKEAAKYVIPLATTMGEKIEALRRWAEGRAIPASVKTTTTTQKARRVVRKGGGK